LQDPIPEPLSSKIVKKSKPDPVPVPPDIPPDTVPKEMERCEIAAVAEKTKQDSLDIKVRP
jgi:hypothetical protein